MSTAIAAIAFGIAVAGAALTHAVFAQSPPVSRPAAPHDHGSMPPHDPHSHTQRPGARHGGPGATPTLPGQDAFGAIAEIVTILESDPTTDWSAVDLERLRQHLIDMNEVVLRSAVAPTPIPGGLSMEITGTGRTERAIRGMVAPHALELDRMPAWSARTELIPGGVRLIVTAKAREDARTVARIRGLGFAGLLAQGAHHQAHHLAMAAGRAPAGRTH